MDFDGSRRHASDSSASRGILRDHHDNFLKDFYCMVNSSSSIFKESWGLRRGMFILPVT